MSEGLETANTLPSYITAYRKGISIDDLTLNHIIFLEDTQQFPHDISAVLSDDIEKFFDRITTETQIVAMYQHGCPKHGYAEWVAETGYHSMALFATKHAHITLMVLCGVKKGRLSLVRPPTVLLPSSQNPSSLHQHCNIPHLLMAMPSSFTHTTHEHLHNTSSLSSNPTVMSIHATLQHSYSTNLSLRYNGLWTELGTSPLLPYWVVNTKNSQWRLLIIRMMLQHHLLTALHGVMIMRPPIPVPLPPIHSRQHNMTLIPWTPSHQPQHTPTHKPLMTPNSVDATPFNKTISLVFTIHSRGTSPRPH